MQQESLDTWGDGHTSCVMQVRLQCEFCAIHSFQDSIRTFCVVVIVRWLLGLRTKRVTEVI
jgi:hypothetical protein